MTSRKIVPPTGNKNAQIVLIGEAPGRSEHEEGKPFVGPSGKLLEKWWRNARPALKRSDFYITNVVPYWPGRTPIDKIPLGEMERYVESIHAQIAELVNPLVIVPVGNVALQALVGRNEITKWRGSILEYRDLLGRTIKVIPTIHPAAVMRQHQWYARCVMDWERIAKEAETHFDDSPLPEREHLIRPSIEDIEAYTEGAAKAKHMALDVETPNRDGQVTCIGFCHEHNQSIVIPTVKDYWGSKVRTDKAWALVKELCEEPSTQKIMQNGLFDVFCLAEHDVGMSNWIWDTMAMHHAIDAPESHSLDFLASIYLRGQYWKEDGRKYLSKRALVDGREKFWIYNGTDACVTYDLLQPLAEQLVEMKLIDFYLAHYTTMFEACQDLARTGVRVDMAEVGKRLSYLLLEQHKALGELAKLNDGKPLHAKKGLSPLRVNKFMYEKLKLPKQKNRKTGKVTADETSIRKLMHRYERFRSAGELLLHARRTHKLSTFIGAGTIDTDYYMRSSYGPFAESGRMRCKGTPRGTGRNAQNTDHEVRSCYVPDPGCIFLGFDLSQAEDRIVKVLTKSPRLIELARLMPGERDTHKENAAAIFDISVSDVTKEQRYLGKRFTHASNYGMRGTKMSEVLAKDGTHMGPKECQAIMDRVAKLNPEIAVWHRETRKQIMNRGHLENSWGRRMYFHNARMEDSTYREAYSFIPQSEIADLMNCWGFIPLHRVLKHLMSDCRINVHMHDGLLVSVPPERAWEVANFVDSTLQRSRSYNDIDLIVPVEYTLGTSWGHMPIEFKRLPQEQVFKEMAYELVKEPVHA